MDKVSRKEKYRQVLLVHTSLTVSWNCVNWRHTNERREDWKNE